MTSTVFLDVEGAARVWLRQHPLVSAETGGRVFFGIPEDNPFPLVTVARIGGSPQNGEVPLEDVRLSFSCYGTSKNSAQKVVRAVSDAFWTLDNEALDDEVFGYSATVDTVLWFPEPDSQTARYIVDVTVTVRAA